MEVGKESKIIGHLQPPLHITTRISSFKGFRMSDIPEQVQDLFA